MAVEYSSQVKCIAESAKAIHVRDEENSKQFWIPKSVIDDDSEVYAMGTSGKLIVADWFAEKEGWD